MGTILASALISRAQNVLVDTGATRWASAEMLQWLNDGQREIVSMSPEANTVVANLTLAAGTKQTMPADAISLVRLVRNMGSGNTPGEAPRLTDSKQLDLLDPSWHAATAALTVKNYVYDPKVPTVFYVYPPMSDTTQVEAEYVKLPTDIATTSDVIFLSDAYANALLDYLLYRSFSKDIEIPGMADHASLHRQAFLAALTPVTATRSKEAEQ